MTKYLFEMARAHFSRCTTPQTLHDHQASLTRGGCQRRLSDDSLPSLMSSDITTTGKLYIIDHLLVFFSFLLIKSPHPWAAEKSLTPVMGADSANNPSRKQKQLLYLKQKKLIPFLRESSRVEWAVQAINQNPNQDSR